MYSYFFLSGRYMLRGPPAHRSATAVVTYALDHGVTAEYEQAYSSALEAHRTSSDELSLEGFKAVLSALDLTHADADAASKDSDLFASFDKNLSLGLSKVDFLQFAATHFCKERKVAVEFMRNREQ